MSTGFVRVRSHSSKSREWNIESENEIWRVKYGIHFYGLIMKCRRRISPLLSWFIRPLEVSLSKYNLTCFWDCPPLKGMCCQQWMLSQKTLSSALIWVLLYKLSLLSLPFIHSLSLFFLIKQSVRLISLCHRLSRSFLSRSNMSVARSDDTLVSNPFPWVDSFLALCIYNV